MNGESPQHDAGTSCVAKPNRRQFKLRTGLAFMVFVAAFACLVGPSPSGRFFGPFILAVALEVNGQHNAAYYAWIATIVIWLCYPIFWAAFP